MTQPDQASIANSLPAGHSIHWYEIVSVLGKGGFGLTYLARDRNLNHAVALKEFFPRGRAGRRPDGTVYPLSEDLQEGFESGLKRFVDEARTLARLRHPVIVRVLSVFEENGTAYMAMEYERGDTLVEVVRTGRCGTERELLRVVDTLLCALAHMHGAGIIHRDLKPDNILIRPDGSAVLLDFGSARRASAGDVPLTAVLTQGYAPFEQYDDGTGEYRQGPWSDLYSLAAVLYFVVAGHAPPDALVRGTTILRGKPDPLVPAAVAGQGRYSARLLEAIDVALQFDSSNRPQRVEEWRALLPLETVSAPAPSAAAGPALDESPQAPAGPASGVPTPTPAAPTVRFETSSADLQPSDANLLAADLRELDVLIVDDEAFVLGLTRRVLARLGVERVTTASNGRRALETIAAMDKAPEIILCDLNMPDMDGLEFLRHLGARRLRSAVVLVSGQDDRVVRAAEVLAHAHGLYFLGALQKPIKPTPTAALLGTYEAHTQQETAVARRVSITEDELRIGIENGAVHVVYQPKVRIADRAVVGVEALARWRHPTEGLLGPGAFVALAEECGLIDALTFEVMRQAFAAAAGWCADGAEIPVSVNVSTDSLDLDFAEQVVCAAESEGLSPALITLEVTETRIMHDLRSALEVLARLRLREVRLAIDDFGTGYSSLEQLRQVPFTEMKIDRAFVYGAATDPSAYAILESSAGLGKRLGLELTAEGVETQADWDAVAAVGCDVVQGFFVARPMEAQALKGWASEWRTQS